MGGTKGIVDIQVKGGGELFDKARLVLFLLLVETSILEHDDITLLGGIDNLFDFLTNAVRGESHFLSEQLSHALSTGSEGELVFGTILGATQVGADSDNGTLFLEVLNGGDRHADTGVVRDGLSIQRDINITTDKDLLSLEVGIRQIFNRLFGLELNKRHRSHVADAESGGRGESTGGADSGGEGKDGSGMGAVSALARPQESQFRWPAREAQIPSLVAQHLGPGLAAPPAELLELLGSSAESVELLRGGGGKKKRDDVRVLLRQPMAMGDLGALQAELRQRLLQSSDATLRDGAHRVEVVPGGVSLGAAAEPREGVVVVDTDVISMLFKDDTRAVLLRDVLARQERRLISFQTAAELHAWILLRHFSEARIERLEAMLSNYEVVWPDNLTCLLWAQLIDHGRANGRPTGPQDAWVAATALRHGARICTNNLKDYDYLPGVRFLHLHELPAADVRDGAMQVAWCRRQRCSLSTGLIAVAVAALGSAGLAVGARRLWRDNT